MANAQQVLQMIRKRFQPDEEQNWAEMWAITKRKSGEVIRDSFQVRMVKEHPAVHDLLLKPCKQATKIHKLKWKL